MNVEPRGSVGIAQLVIARRWQRLAHAWELPNMTDIHT
jgi:hypothetical protein